MQALEHRRHPRFHVFGTTARSGTLEAAVLNLSRTGMLLESSGELPVGLQLHFELSDRQHHLQVEALVRWSRHRGGQPAGSHVPHRSGVQFSRILSGQARGVWARLVAETGKTEMPVDHGPPSPRPTASQMPMLTILAPEDGTVVPDEFVTVIGQIRDRGLGMGIEVNGVRASVSGQQFQARVGLTRGANLLTAAITTSGAQICRSATVRIIASPLSLPEA